MHIRRVNINGKFFISDPNVNRGEVTIDKTTVTTESVRLLHNLGYTPKEIAEHFGITRSQVGDAFLRYGVRKPKTPKRA